MNQYLRPMGIGEILDSAVKLYKEGFPYLVMAQIPLVYLYLVYNLFFWYIFRDPGPFSVLGHPFADLLFYFLEYGSVHLLWKILVLSLAHIVVVYPLTLAAVTRVASDYVLQGHSSLKNVYRSVFKIWWKLGVTNVIMTVVLMSIALAFSIGILLILYFVDFDILSNYHALILFGAIFAAELPAFLLWARWTAVYPSMVNEEIFTVGALKRSWTMTKGYTLKVFLVCFLVLLIFLVTVFSARILHEFFGIPSYVLFLVFGAAAQGFIMPLMDCTRVVVYFELRTRKEGLDLEKRVEKLPE